MNEKLFGPDEITAVGIVGAGAIGASWAAFWLAQGLDVVAYDPDPAAADLLELPELPAPTRPRGTLRWANDLAAAASDSQLVIEAGPERLDIKRELFRELDAAADSRTLLASSSSGIMPSQFQDACARFPDRAIVAHPFNPPHLMPLVEVVGGRATGEAVVERAVEIFASFGKQPIRVDTEVPGHIANRLQAALWREAYSLVERGVCSVSDVDTAIASGPGLRWALLGPLATQHLSGGPGGLAHVLTHLGPPMLEWWEDLREPAWTPELRDRLVAGVREEIPDADLPALTRQRDAALAELLRLKAGAELNGGTSHGR